MLKKVFDPNKMKNSGSSNIEYRIGNLIFKIVFDIENLICGNFLDAKEHRISNLFLNLNFEYRKSN